MSTRRVKAATERRFANTMSAGLVFVLIASLFSVSSVQAAPPGTPAPVRPLPICEQLSEPPTASCPRKSDFFTISSIGALSGAGSVAVTVVSSIPPCEVGNSFFDTWSPSLCYSGIKFGRIGFCAYIDQITEEYGPCTALTYQGRISAGNNLIFEGPELAPGSTETRASRGATADFGTFAWGGPGNSDLRLDRRWSNLAPNAQTYVLSLDRTADDLFGASWGAYIVQLELRRDGERGADPEGASTQHILEGTLGPLAQTPTRHRTQNRMILSPMSATTRTPEVTSRCCSNSRSPKVWTRPTTARTTTSRVNRWRRSAVGSTGPRAPELTAHVRLRQPRLTGLYLMRCGRIASTPCSRLRYSA
ncbi:MAG: hypothetical protein ACI9C1_003084 [Candidatus Aldehydirespiratoraceae bacterium]|jgi:hypothetical protein